MEESINTYHVLEQMADRPQRLKAFTSNSGRDYGLFVNEKANRDFKNVLKCLILSISSTAYFPKPSTKSDLPHPAIKEDRLIKQCLKSLH